MQIEQALTEAEVQKALLTVELKRVEEARHELEQAEAEPSTGSVDALRERIAHQPAIEEHLHGPDEVIALLANDPPPAPPAFHEVRGGLIVRWIDIPG